MRRKSFDKDALRELADSVKTHGLLQPLVVRPRPEEKTGGVTIGSHFEIVAGERRFLAAKIAKLESVPVNVRDLNDEQVLEIQLIENLQREGVHPMLEAEGYHELVHKYHHPIEDVYAKIGKSRSYVYGRMKLLALCREARQSFYQDEVSASVALLIARIPDDKLQQQALAGIKDDRMSYREAVEYVRDHFMLQLAKAQFPVDDATLVAAAGACTSCPKRTGNQPELFGDIKGPDVCTDPGCFEKKVVAFGKIRIARAVESGQTVITGDDAKKVAKYGFEGSLVGYERLDRDRWLGAKTVKTAKIVGKDAPIALLHDETTGRVVEVVPSAIVDAALKKLDKTRSSAPGSSSTSSQHKAEQKAKAETKFRQALYAAIRPKLKPPTLKIIATALFDRLEHDAKERLAKVRGFEIPTKKQSWGSVTKDVDALAKTIDGLDEAELGLFVNDCYHVHELRAHSYGGNKPERLLAAAKACKVDPAKIRRELAAKTKPKRKARK